MVWGGLLAGGAAVCVWTRRVMPSIRGEKEDGIRLERQDGPHNKVNNDILHIPLLSPARR